MIEQHITTLISNAKLGTPGTDLFIDYAPASVLAAVMVLPSLAGASINWQMPGWRKDAPLQLIVRNPDRQTGENLALAIMPVLTITKQTLLPSPAAGLPAVLVSYIRPMHDPIVYPRQQSSGWEVSVNFRASYARQDGSP